MLNFSKCKVGTRLYSGFGALIVLLLALQVNAYVNFTRLGQAVGWNTHTYEVMIEVDEILTSLVNIETGERGFALTGNEDSLEPLRLGMEAYKQHFDKAKSLTSDNREQQDRFARLETQYEQWQSNGVKPVIDMRRAVNAGNQNVDHLLALIKEGKGKRGMDGMRALLSDIRSAESSLLDKRAKEMVEQERWTGMTVLAGSIFALVLGIGMALLITRSLLRSLGGEPEYSAQIANRIAEGDLTMEVTVAANDTTSLLYAIKAMRNSLAGIVGQVRNATDSISTGSAEIASGNADLSSRTEQQASSLEETASSMEELTSTVRQNAENAKQANGMAQTASRVATEGGAVVSEVVQTMAAINEAARKIADITGVIDGIAFQTNILALNAAVEAARAGEQGRGFAVVASEVRNLAQRSAAAAKEIKTLIGDSVDKVESGSRLVDQAGTTMDEVVRSVKRVTDLIAEIAAASEEQRAGIEQVNEAIAQMDQVTQQNAALVEQAAAAAESMQHQSSGLSDMVSVFKIEQQRAAAPSSRPEPAPRTKAPSLPAARGARPASSASAIAPRTSQQQLAQAVPAHDQSWEEF